ncbi:MAG TPA: dihydrofolate reductase family protein [Pyrinomonadaceae bacterium]|jgi:dihydrofolate reductase
MRKLKLQMQTTLDAFVAAADGGLDWMIWDWDAELKKYVTELTAPVDLILLGRNLAEGFIDAWTSRLDLPAPENDGARKMVETPKIVFSKSLANNRWENAEVFGGDLVEKINELKNRDGGDIIAYGGARFVSSLIENDLIDEYHLFVNPVALGKGMTIFGALAGKLNLKLAGSKSFPCGIAGLFYQPK